MHWKIVRFFVLFVLLTLNTLSGADNSRILRIPGRETCIVVLHSHNQADARVTEINMGLDYIYSGAGKLYDEISFEYLDTLENVGPEYMKMFSEAFHDRYCRRGKKPELVIASGNLALDFLKGYFSEYHPDVPVVFCGINDFSPAMLPRSPCTGVVQEPDVKGTVRMIRQLQSDVKRLILIADDMSVNTKTKAMELKRQLKVYAPEYHVENWFNVPLDEMVTQISRLSDDTVVLMGIYTQDRKGQVYSPSQVVRILESKSSVPIYSFWDYMITAGATGGVVISPYLQGMLAAELSIEVLNGTNPKDIPIKRNAASELLVNWPQIERFGLDVNRLKPRPKILNYMPNVFEVFGQYMGIIIAAIACETIIILLLILQVYKRKTSERQTRRSRAMLRMVIDHVPNGLLAIDRYGKITLVNESMAKFLESSVDEIQGRYIDEIRRSSPELASKLKTNLRVVGFYDKSMSLTDVLIPGNGRHDKWVNISHNPFTQGDQKAMLVVLENITQKKIDQQLQDESNKIRIDVLENLPDGVALLDKELRIQWVNKKLMEYYSRCREELIGKKCFDCKFYRNEPCPNCPVMRAIQLRRPCRMERQDPETGRYWDVRAAPILSSNNEVQGVVEIIQDITDKIESDSENKVRLETLETIFNALPAGVVIIDTNKRVIRANRCALDMMKIEFESEIVGQICHSRFCMSEAGKCPVLDLGQHVDNSERVLLTSDGEILPILKTVTPFTLMGQEVLIEVFVDISEYKHQQQLETQAEKLEVVGQIAGGIAPEFNNQLMTIMGYASMLENELTDSRMLEFVKAIETAARQSSDITQNLLAFSRKGRLITTKVDLHMIIRDVITEISKNLPENILIEKQLAAESTQIVGDSSEIYNAIFNVAVNAREAMADGGRLLFVTNTSTLDSTNSLRQAYDAPVGHYFKLSIIDTGSGMDKEMQKHIFEPFYSTKSKGPGAGMSLTATMGVVKGHNGFIEINSTEGLGTAFNIYLLMQDEDQASQEAIKKTVDSEVKVPTLIISPEQVSRKMLAKSLKSKGYSIFTADKGAEGINCFEREKDKIGLVLLSMEMDDGTPREIFEKLKHIKYDIKVIILTNQPVDEKAQLIMNHGAQAIITLPCTEVKLLKTIAETLRASN